MKTKYITLTLLFLSVIKLTAGDEGLWKLFLGAKNRESANKLYQISSNYDSSYAALLTGYRAMGSLMMCDHVSNPIEKLSFFREGKKWLEYSIRRDPLNPKLRFFRYTVQINTPSFLGYNHDRRTDKKIILDYLSKTPKDRETEIMAQFLLNSENKLSKEEKVLLLLHKKP